jgi:steroid 5-alpha reductase family enzyme
MPSSSGSTPERFGLRGFGRLSAGALGVVAAVQAGTWVASRRAGRVNVVDVAWGPGIAGVAMLAAVTGRGDRPRRLLLAAGTTAWGARLAIHVQRASAGRGEDPRYAEMLAGAGPLQRITKVFGTQGAAQWLISLPIQVAAASGPPRGKVARASVAAGTALMAGGGLIEALADEQKAAWKAKPDHGPVMDEGLWAYSRHPNYFGDTCLWWGIYLIAAAARPGAWTIVSPAVMTWLLTMVTGARRSERMHQGDPDYAAYQRRVSFFLPRPPAQPASAA